MTAQFVSLAVGYSLAGGQLRRKGARQRPWLELRRLETEASYLEHQLRALRRAVRQPIRVDTDMVPGRGYYDICRARIHSPLLERALELTANGLTDEALQAAGVRGLACLWLDSGRWSRDGGEVPFASRSDAEVFRTALHRLQIPAATPMVRHHLVRISPMGMRDLARILRPHVHRSMRHALRPGSRHGMQLLTGLR